MAGAWKTAGNNLGTGYWFRIELNLCDDRTFRINIFRRDFNLNLLAIASRNQLPARTGDFFHPSRRLSVIVMVQPAQDRTPANSTTYFLRFTRIWDLLLKPLMWSLAVVEGNVFLQNPLDLTSANQQKIVQRLSSHSSEESLHDAVHIRRFYARLDGYQIVGQEVNIEHQRVVMDQIRPADYGFAEKHQLLPDKFPGGILGHGKPHDLACLV